MNRILVNYTIIKLKEIITIIYEQKNYNYIMRLELINIIIHEHINLNYEI